MKAKRSSPSRKADEFPKSIREGSAEGKIYLTPVTVGGKDYAQFTVSYYLGGKRIRQRFSDLSKAETEAQAAVVKLSNADHEALKLSPSDRAAYVQCLDLLRPWGMPLSVAVTDYVAALAKLPPGASLVEAVADYAKRHPANAPKRTVTEAVTELIEDRRAAGCSEVHLRDMQTRLGRFSRAFQVQLSTVSASLVRDYLRALTTPEGKPAKNRTKRNVLRLISALFHFSRKRGFISRELADEIAEIDAPKSEHTEIGIFSPADIRALLSTAAPELVAPMAIGAFAGLRTAEIARLDWSEIKLAERVVIVGAAKSKTASRRVVPITDNLAAWLAPYARQSGSVNPCTSDALLSNRFSRVADRLGMVWVENGLRHSFVSYRLAVTHDPARVANEAGHSPSMLHKNYKALVTEAEGKDWFAIMPSGEAADVLPMPLASEAA